MKDLLKSPVLAALVLAVGLVIAAGQIRITHSSEDLSITHHGSGRGGTFRIDNDNRGSIDISGGTLGLLHSGSVGR